jgi:hypothetical protein
MKTVDDIVLFVFALFVALSMGASSCSSVGTGTALAQEHEPFSDELVGEVVIYGDARPAVSLPIEWTDSTRLALGQCLVAEARWRNRTEHSAIAHVLERRWRRYNAAHPSAPISFEQQVRAYCHVHRARREDSSNGWVLSLQWGPLEEDPGMGPTVNWRNWRDDWDFARETVSMFERGELRDPMPLAMTFGGAMDSAGPDLVYLGPTTTSIEDGARILLHNRFYALRATIARASSRVRP